MTQLPVDIAVRQSIANEMAKRNRPLTDAEYRAVPGADQYHGRGVVTMGGVPDDVLREALSKRKPAKVKFGPGYFYLGGESKGAQPEKPSIPSSGTSYRITPEDRERYEKYIIPAARAKALARKGLMEVPAGSAGGYYNPYAPPDTDLMKAQMAADLARERMGFDMQQSAADRAFREVMANRSLGLERDKMTAEQKRFYDSMVAMNTRSAAQQEHERELQQGRIRAAGEQASAEMAARERMGDKDIASRERIAGMESRLSPLENALAQGWQHELQSGNISEAEYQSKLLTLPSARGMALGEPANKSVNVRSLNALAERAGTNPLKTLEDVPISAVRQDPSGFRRWFDNTFGAGALEKSLDRDYWFGTSDAEKLNSISIALGLPARSGVKYWKNPSNAKDVGWVGLGDSGL